MSKISILTTLLATTLLFQACSNEKNNEVAVQKANALLSTQATPNKLVVTKNKFILTGLDNKQYVIEKTAKGFQLKNAKGKILMLDIFATWCPPCQAEASHLASLQKSTKII